MTDLPLILVDENIPEAQAYFGRLGRVQRFAGRDLRPAQLRGARALIVRSITRVDAALLAGAPVDFVGTCTIGTDHVDLDYLASRGIAFASAPGCNANSVVEYVLCALAALDCCWQGKRVGIVGCGNVGGALYRALDRLGARVCGYDPLIPSDRFPALVGLEQVLDGDIVCLHTPLTRSGPQPSHHLLGEAELNRLRPGALLINAGRGPVVDNDALLAVAQTRPDLRLVLDVWEQEPWVEPALLARTAIGTPHIAGYSYDGKLQGTRMIYQALCQAWRRPADRGAAAEQGADADLPLPVLGAGDWQQVRAQLLAAYDIAADDGRLRQALAGIEDRAEAGAAFDALRKHYPVRREFRHQPPLAAALGPVAADWLRRLGFVVA